MKQKVRQILMIVISMIIVFFMNQSGTVVAMAPQAMIEGGTDTDLVTIATLASVETGESADTSFVLAQCHQEWQDECARRLEQERIRKQEELRKQQERERKERERKARIRRKKLAQQRKIKKRKRAIQHACGQISGTQAQTILERIVEAEAGGEDQEGRILVANVVLNRVISKQFPNSVKAVVFAHGGGTYQFSPVSNGSYYSVKVSKGTKKAVQAALAGKDPSQGALYFMERSLADRGNVSWFDRCLTRLFRHGCHEFYK